MQARPAKTVRTGFSNHVGAATFKEGEKVYSAGLGFGHDFIFSNRFSAAAEISSQGLYLGNFDSANILTRSQLNFQVQLVKGIRIFAGPSYSIYNTGPAVSSAAGYKKQIGPARSFNSSKSTRRWSVWSVGITLL